MNHLVIDLEMCKVPGNYRTSGYKYASEIIQIGAVLLDEEFKQIAELRQYVHPEHGVIDNFIEYLTGIQDCNVKNAPLLSDALDHMISWIGKREYNIYAWSGTDRDQLLKEIRIKNIENEAVESFMQEDRWIDYQKVFSDRFDFSRKLSLEEALDRAEVQPVGRAHDGLCDAANTGLLIEKLEMDPDFELKGYVLDDEARQPIGSSLADIFANLNLQIA